MCFIFIWFFCVKNMLPGGREALWKITEIPRGGRVSRALLGKEIPEERGGVKEQKALHGWGMDIFWNQTI